MPCGEFLIVYIDYISLFRKQNSVRTRIVKAFKKVHWTVDGLMDIFKADSGLIEPSIVFEKKQTANF